MALALAAGSQALAAPPALEVRKGDHIAFLGNTVADRMQHDGWLETMLHARFPGDELVIRNMGFSADELTIRLRSKDFGTPDEWLAKTKADVIFAFFGSNEAYGDPAKYRQDLDAFVKHTLAQAYAGKGAPRLVVFSPIAHEGAKGRPLPDGAAHNALLEQVTAATAEVAKANGVAYVDLYHPSLKLFADSPEPLTINGIHPNEEGNRQLAKVIDGALFGEPAPAVDTKGLDAIRTAVLEKNHYWFNRYRVVDGYSTYGGRADLKFTDGQTNRVVMDRELEVIDIMTANRDKAVWAAANGKTLVVDDSNTPPFIPVKTNKPGEGPNGEHIFLDGDEAIGKMTVGKDFNINLFASEKQFPDLAKPVQMSFDPAGRLWVAVWPTYPHWKPKETMNDKIIILEDTDGDGRADKQTTFADGLHCPTGFEFVPGGVLVAQQPDLMLLKDTDGDDKVDVRTRVLHGLDSADTHHAANSFRLDPGGAVYFQEGTFHHSQVETPYGPPVRCVNAGVYRYEPRTQKFEVYVSYGFANPHGHSFDHWGQDFITDGTGAVNYFAAAFSGHVDYPRKHPGMKPFFPQRTRPCPGTEIVSSKHFPDEMQGNYLVGNVIGFQGILNYKMRDEESGFGAEEVEPIVSSSDPNFRPSDLEMGPDGALDGVVGQMLGNQHRNGIVGEPPGRPAPRREIQWRRRRQATCAPENVIELRKGRCRVLPRVSENELRGICSHEAARLARIGEERHGRGRLDQQQDVDVAQGRQRLIHRIGDSLECRPPSAMFDPVHEDLAEEPHPVRLGNPPGSGQRRATRAPPAQQHADPTAGNRSNGLGCLANGSGCDRRRAQRDLGLD